MTRPAIGHWRERCHLVKLVPVTQMVHSGKSWRRPPDFRFAAKDAMAPIVAPEFGSVAPWMPIVFTQQAGHWLPMAMMSPVAGHNLFVDAEGKWLGGYVPAALRSFPFFRARIEGREDEVVCFDEDSGLLADQRSGEDFFAENGEPSVALRQISDVLQAVSAAQQPTKLAMASLAEAGIIEPWPLRVKVGNSQEGEIAGLHRIKETALNALDDAAFLKLRKTGALVLAHMQLVSMGQMARFHSLFRQQQQSASARAALESRETLDDLFGMPSDDTIRFN
jgi:hypothetical protein